MLHEKSFLVAGDPFPGQQSRVPPSYTQAPYPVAPYPQPQFQPWAYCQPGFPQGPYPQGPCIVSVPYLLGPYPQGPYHPVPYLQGPYLQVSYSQPHPAFPVDQDLENTLVISYHEDKQPSYCDGQDVPTTYWDDKSVRQVFIRKVFLTLTIQLIVGFTIVAVFTFVNVVKDFIQSHAWTYYVMISFFFGTMLVVICCGDIRRKHPWDLVALTVLTMSSTFMLAFTSIFKNTNAVIIAMGITIAVCFSIVLFSLQTKYDFSASRGVLFVCLIVLVIFSFLASLNRTTAAMYGSIMALLWCCFLVVDIQLIMGNKKQTVDPEEFIFVVCNLYVDIMFIYSLIVILMNWDGNN